MAGRVEIGCCGERLGEGPRPRASLDVPRVLFGTDGETQDLGALVRIGHRPVRRQHVAHGEPVRGQRPGLVGDDQVDRAERLLRRQPPYQDTSAKEAVRAQA
jgi:hypothetical protein